MRFEVRQRFIGLLPFWLLSLASVCISVPSSSADTLTASAFTAVPSRFATKELTLGARGLGETCYSRGTMPDGTVCNPAFLDEVPTGFLLGRVYIGNGYSALNTANQLIFQPMSKEFLEGLFRKENITSLESNLSLVFGTKNFSASFSPYRIQYFSEVHNPNYPVIAIHAAVERALTFQSGGPLGGFSDSLKEFSLGGNLRLLERTYVHSSFSLAQVVRVSPQELVPVHRQYAAFMDPTVGWRSSSLPWSPRASLGVVNLGISSRHDPLYEDLIDLAGGVGIEPPIGFGRLRLGVDAINPVHAESLSSVFRLGTSYQLGIMEAITGWNRNAITGGLQFGFQIIQAGIIYEFARSEISGGFSDNRISTELSVKL